jgi:hypothetical protein
VELKPTAGAGLFDRDLCPVRVAIPALQAGPGGTLAAAGAGLAVPCRVGAGSALPPAVGVDG